MSPVSNGESSRGKKRCARCGMVKGVADFNHSGKSADGLQSYCRACEREYRRQHSRGTCVNASDDKKRWFLCSTCGYEQRKDAFGRTGMFSDMPAFCPACGDVIHRPLDEGALGDEMGKF